MKWFPNGISRPNQIGDEVMWEGFRGALRGKTELDQRAHVIVFTTMMLVHEGYISRVFGETDRTVTFEKSE